MSALREIIAKFGISFDDAELKKGMESIKGGIKLLKGFAGALGVGLSLGAIKDFVVGITEQAVALDKQARYLRIGVEELQRWQQAAQIAGASSEALNGALEQMRLRSRKPTEALMQVADRVAAIKDPTRRAMIGTAMLGNSYRELEPLLEKGSKGIKKLLSESEDLAVVFGKDSVVAAKENRANLARLSIVWNGLTTQIGALLLPVLAQLTKALVPVFVWFKNITKHTHLFRAAALVLGGGGLFTLVRRFGSLGGALKAAMPFLRMFGKQLLTTALAAAKVVLPLLILEDFLVFLSGGKSAFGEILDKVFGKGTADKVRQWITDIKARFLEFLDDVKNKPREAVNTLLKWFGVDPTSGWKAFFESFVVTLNAVLNAFEGGWDGAKAFFKSTWDGIALIAEIAWTELKFGFLHLAAIVGDAFADMWNGILSGGQGVVKFLGKAAGALGASDTAKSLAEAAKSLELNKSDANAASIIERARDAERLRIAAKGDTIGQQFAAPKADVTQNVNVTVPAGTPAQTANRVATATAKAMQKNNQATRAALVPGQG